MTTTPNFALDLSEENISLLQRRADGMWDIIGQASLESDDLAGALHALRKTALDAGGENFATKLILPPSQLFYGTLETGSREEIVALLEANTPYTIEKLSYDLSGEVPDIKVVAVARETLDEAQTFLAPYLFNPQGFTAVPKRGTFEGEPDLGPVRGVEAFTTDANAVKIYTQPSQRTADPLPEPESLEVSDDLVSKEREKETRAKEDRARELALNAARREAEAKEKDNSILRTALNRRGATSDPKNRPITAMPPPSVLRDRVQTRRVKSAPEDVKASETAKPVAAQPAAAKPVEPKKGAIDPPVQRTKPEPAAVTGPRLMPAAKADVLPQFGPASPQTAELRSNRTKHMISGQTRVQRPVSRILTNNSINAVDEKFRHEFLTPKKKSGLDGLATRPVKGPMNKTPLYITAAAIVLLGGFATAIATWIPSGGFGLSDRQTANTEIEPVVMADADEAERLLSEINREAENTSEAETASTADAGDATEAAPAEAGDEVAVASADTPSDETAVTPWQEGSGPRAETTPTALASAIDPSASVPDIATPRTLPVLNERDETGLVDPQLPPPPGARFTLNDQGLVVPSEEGSFTPDGALIIAGAPPETPPWRDGTLQLTDEQTRELERQSQQTRTTPEDVSQDTQTATAPESAEQVANAGASLAGIAPGAGVDPVLPADPSADAADDATAAEQQLNPELIRFRPTERPASLADRAADRARSEAILKAVEDAARGAALTTPDAAAPIPGAASEATGLAAIRPISRPPGLRQLAARAREQTAAQQSASASTAPVTRTGPAVASESLAAPSGPTRQSVAKAATEPKVVPLGKLSLIGVFGKAQSRRALLRLPNGKFARVSVGDQINGGRVASISETSLRYSNGSRTVVLEMPKS